MLLFLPIFFPPKENALFVKKNWLEPEYIYKEKIPPFEWIYENKLPTNNELSTMVVLGDSFFDGMMRSGLGIYFKKILL